MKVTSIRASIRDTSLCFSRTDLLIKLILLFPITTLLQYHIGILNKLLFFVVISLLLCTNAVRPKSFVYLMFVTVLWVFDMIITPPEALRLNLNMSFYYIFLVYYLVFFLAEQDKIWQILKDSRYYILGVVLVYTSVLTVSIFLPSSYQVVNTWGQEKYFMSISGSPNRVGPASVFILVLITFLLQVGSHKLLALCALPQLYAVFMGGSRTYFVLGLCAALIMYYILFPKKKWFYLSLIPVSAIALFFVLKSNMAAKFAVTIQDNLTQGLSKQEFWRRVTNTRSVFWVDQLKLFFDTPWYKQLFGNGINFTTHQYGLWAHSDFIEILCSYGYVGLANYIVLMIYTIRNLLKTKKRYTLIKFVCVFIWFFNAFINFFYCYFCAMLCFPILLLTVKHMDEKKTGNTAPSRI